MLCVALLQITKTAYQLLAGDILVVGKQIALGGLSGVVDEDVGIGGHTCDGADHVAKESGESQYFYLLYRPNNRKRKQVARDNALVKDIELLGRGVLLQQLRRHLALSGQDDAILGEDSDSSSGMRDGLEGIFNLV